MKRNDLEGRWEHEGRTVTDLEVALQRPREILTEWTVTQKVDGIPVRVRVKTHVESEEEIAKRLLY